MPRGDGSGPLGQGPLTGRRMGNCQVNNERGGFFRGLGSFFGYGCGRGRGRGFAGQGRGFNNRGYGQRNFFAEYPENQMLSKEQQVDMLRSQKVQYEENLKRINEELDKYDDN
ncbi:MAG TPA: DUF5320 domain-containing protein [Candidatus Cloacimonadota bacterium]|mgnify:FL=1|nr:DUF5320 domain-containing protein [Candidatus Cloacimonadota bacterium]HQB40283.1 DUF5320 domain-containing protein [Candidatus Cloacimonadota bacterium]